MTKSQEELLPRRKLINYSADDKNETNMYDAFLHDSKNSIWPTLRLTLTVLSIGAGWLLVTYLSCPSF
jgi:hypothetical protein